MTFDINPSDEDPHGECRHEIQWLEAESAKLHSAIAKLRESKRYNPVAWADGIIRDRQDLDGEYVKHADIAAILEGLEVGNATTAT